MNQCEPFHAELGAYHDGALATAQSKDVERHLQGCGPCRAELARLDSLDAAIRSMPRTEPSADFAEQFYARMASETRRSPARRSRWMQIGWAGAGALAAAAAAVLLAVRSPQDPAMTGEDWQIVSDEDAFEVVLQEDPDLLYALDALETDDWSDEEGQS
jgi:anti-sigma factor RsiW